MLGILDVGGGTRGIYGAGVLDLFLENGIGADYFIGVSTGAANGAAFAAHQLGRNRKYYTDYAFRREYMGIGNLIRKGSYLDLDYIYSTLSDSAGECPLDFPAVEKEPMQLEIVATNALTGEATYFSKKDLSQDHYEPIKASCCVPVLCKPYLIDGIPYFDGGLSDPIPFQRAFDAGCDHLIVILTKPKYYLRATAKDERIARILKGRYPAAAEALSRRAEVYNSRLIRLLQLEATGRVTIIAPAGIGKLKTLTRDREQLMKLYHMGYEDARTAGRY